MKWEPKRQDMVCLRPSWCHNVGQTETEVSNLLRVKTYLKEDF